LAAKFWHTFGMACVGDLGFRCRSVAWGMRFLLFVFFLCALGLPILWSGALLRAQAASTPQDGPIHTLHVYTNLIQMPTLVLGPYREKLKKPIAESRFSVSIDSGRWFPATHVRLEGDDPISLSILLDVGGDATDLVPKIDDAIAGLVPLSLHPVDHISIYALDCSLVRSWNNVSAGNEGLKDAVDNALQSWTIRRQKKHGPNCRQSIHLWDALAYLIGESYKLPGRRVILVMSDGKDRGSENSWNDVRLYAQVTGVAVFGLTSMPQYGTSDNRRFLQLGGESPFPSICELSGGMVMFTSTRSLEETLTRFVAMLRERYIVEFPRPANSTAGSHDIRVTIAKGEGNFIRSSGISVPLPDAAVLRDPTTVPSDPSLTPEQGTRAPMKKPQ
jgi:hypothetical protein